MLKECRNQNEIAEKIESMIPDQLIQKYGHLSYGEMAEEPELDEWRSELEEAEKRWFELEE